MASLIFSSLLLLLRSLPSAKGKTSYFLELSYVMLSGSREISLFEGVVVKAEELSSKISKLFLEHKSARPFVSSQATLALSH